MKLVVPDPSVIVLVGIAGCGKSTFAARHFRSSEVLSSDACREMVADDPTDQSATADAFSVLRFILDKRMRRRRLTVVDATSLERNARKPYLQLARKYGVPPVAIVLDLPFEVCSARNATRTDRRVGEDVLQRQHRELRRGLRQLASEDYDRMHVLRSAGEVNEAHVIRVASGPADAPLAGDERPGEKPAGLER